MEHNFCDLCREPLIRTEVRCSYCGLIHVETLTKRDEEQRKSEITNLRSDILGKIDEIGFVGVTMNFDGDNFKNGKIKASNITLLNKSALISGKIIGCAYNIGRGRFIELYKKTAGKKDTFCTTINIPPELEKFFLGTKINERLKLDFYCRAEANGEWGWLISENVKIGESIMEG